MLLLMLVSFFFLFFQRFVVFDATAPTEIYPLSLHDALPIFFALAPAAGEWSPARAQALSRAPWRAVEIAAITAGVSWASVVSMREIVGVEATSPNTPGSHRSKSVSRATSPPTARVIARSSTTFAACCSASDFSSEEGR